MCNTQMFESRYFNTLDLFLFKSGEANSLMWKSLPYYITIQMMLEYSSQHKKCPPFCVQIP